MGPTDLRDHSYRLGGVTVKLSNPWYWWFIAVANFVLAHFTGKDHFATIAFVAVGVLAILERLDVD